MIALVPAVRDRAVVESGQVVVRPMMKLCASFDHRIIDGHSAAAICRLVRGYFDAPEQLL
jgi:2-oxoglutarate dehydrogenase E2 component (dihydrolipoamide succinyltransferase)